MLNAVYRLARSDAVGIIGIYVVVKGLELSALLPRQRMTEVGRRVALRVVAYRLLAVSCKQVFPCAVAVGVRYPVLCILSMLLIISSFAE